MAKCRSPGPFHDVSLIFYSCDCRVKPRSSWGWPDIMGKSGLELQLSISINAIIYNHPLSTHLLSRAEIIGLTIKFRCSRLGWSTYSPLRNGESFSFGSFCLSSAQAPARTSSNDQTMLAGSACFLVSLLSTLDEMRGCPCSGSQGIMNKSLFRYIPTSLEHEG